MPGVASGWPGEPVPVLIECDRTEGRARTPRALRFGVNRDGLRQAPAKLLGAPSGPPFTRSAGSGRCPIPTTRPGSRALAGSPGFSALHKRGRNDDETDSRR